MYMSLGWQNYQNNCRVVVLYFSAVFTRWKIWELANLTCNLLAAAYPKPWGTNILGMAKKLTLKNDFCSKNKIIGPDLAKKLC